MKSPWILNVIREELFSLSSLLWILVGALAYTALSVILLNFRLLTSLLPAPFPFLAKLSIFFSLFLGLWTSLSMLDFLLVIINSLLVGATIVLLAKTIYQIGHSKKMKLSIGGATLISLISTGCASCGLSILSFVGLSASLSFLPFHGMEIHILSTLVLLFSLIYMLRQLYNAKYCLIPAR